MKHLFTISLITFGLLVMPAVSVMAEDQAAPEPGIGAIKQELKDAKKQQYKLRKDFAKIQKRLNLYKDEEIIELKKAVKDAQNALRAKIKEKIGNDSDGVDIVKKMEDIDSKIKELKTKIRNEQKIKRERKKREKKKGGKKKEKEMPAD